MSRCPTDGDHKTVSGRVHFPCPQPPHAIRLSPDVAEESIQVLGFYLGSAAVQLRFASAAVGDIAPSPWQRATSYHPLPQWLAGVLKNLATVGSVTPASSSAPCSRVSGATSRFGCRSATGLCVGATVNTGLGVITSRYIDLLIVRFSDRCACSAVVQRRRQRQRQAADAPSCRAPSSDPWGRSALQNAFRPSVDVPSGLGPPGRSALPRRTDGPWDRRERGSQASSLKCSNMQRPPCA